MALLASVTLTAGCGSQDAAPTLGTRFASSAEIWMHPHPYSPVYGGSLDFDGLLAGSTQWPTVAAHTQVFGLYAGWITGASDAEIAQLAALLTAHDMRVEIEAPALQASASCGSGIEGFVPNGQSLEALTLAYLQRLKSAGADVAYVKVDEPYYFGSVSGEPGACQWPVAQVAVQVAQFAQLVHAVYPNAEVGDTEPIISQAYAPDVVTALTQWHDTYQAASASPFPFYVADLDFADPAWPALATAMANAVHARGMRFGIIYTGDLTDGSSAMWADKAVARFQAFQGTANGQPDYVLFQSWMPYPVYCLPEGTPSSLTGVVRSYLQATSP